MGNQTESAYLGFQGPPSSLVLHMANQTEQTFASVSSLSSSNDNTPEKALSDTSPMSTLTGQLLEKFNSIVKPVK
jgi:hypothetical protein